MRTRLLRLVLVVLLPLAVCSCAGHSAPAPDVDEWWLADEFDQTVFVSFHTAIEDTVETVADLPPADTCEGRFYATCKGEDVALWVAKDGEWVLVAPQRGVE